MGARASRGTPLSSACGPSRRSDVVTLAAGGRGMTMTTIRSYVGLGANLGRRARDARRGPRGARGAPGRASWTRSRASTAPARRRRRPARLPQRRRRRSTCRPARIRRRGALALLGRAEVDRAGVRAPGRASAGVRASSTSTCSCSGRRGCASSVRRASQGRRSGPRASTGSRCRIRRRTSACSCSRRWPTSRPGSMPPGWGADVATPARRAARPRGPGRRRAGRDLGAGRAALAPLRRA